MTLILRDFVPGGASLHNQMSALGHDLDAFKKA